MRARDARGTRTLGIGGKLDGTNQAARLFG